MAWWRKKNDKIPANAGPGENGSSHPAGTDKVVYDLIWSIPDSYGGMTSAMLSRIRAFLAHGLADRVVILTLTQQDTIPRAQQHIRERWGLESSVEVRNLWHDLYSLSASELEELPAGGSDESPLVEIWVGGEADFPHARVFYTKEGKIRRLQFYRADGSVALLDDREPGHRVIALLDEQGIVIKTWTSMTDLNLSWLDFAMRVRPSIAICEHKTIGELLTQRSFPGVELVQVFHGSHLRRPPEGPFSELQPQRAKQVANLDSFARVVLLTESQFRDVESLGVDMSNVRIIPNFSPTSIENSEASRDSRRGVFVGSLRSLKRVDHLLEAFARLSENSGGTGASRKPLAHLDIYGGGDEEDRLRHLAKSLGVEDAVVFHGHTSRAAKQFSQASFMTLTSKMEGQPLVLIEAMERGCVPIAYDIRYGPRDIIENSVNGFLVPDGDIGGLAEAISTFLEMPADEVDEMRSAAVRTAERFSEAQAMTRWGALLEEISSGKVAVSQRRNSKAPKFKAQLARVSRGSDSWTLDVTADHDAAQEMTHGKAALVIEARDGTSFVKRPLVPLESNSLGEFRCELVDEELPISRGRYDCFAEFQGPFGRTRARLGVGEVVIPQPDKQEPRLYSTEYGNLSLEVS